MTLRLVNEPIPLHDEPPFTDIPGRLLQLAVDIENGEYPVTSVIVLIPEEGDFPAVVTMGSYLGEYAMIAILELAKTWFLNNNTTR